MEFVEWRIKSRLAPLVHRRPMPRGQGTNCTFAYANGIPACAVAVTGLASRGMNKAKLSLWSMLLLWWTCYSVFYAEQLMRWSAAAGQPIGFRQALLGSIAGWLTWVPFSLFLIRLVRRWPMEQGTIGRSLLALNFGALAVILAKASYMYWTNPLFGWYSELPAFWEVCLASLRNNLLLCWLVIGAAHGLLYAERSRQRERQISELLKNLSQAKLEALSAQLNPHFLFNTLNSIAELVHHDADASDRMLVGLSALLRRSLSGSSEQEVRLSEELEMLSHYLEIQKVRLGARLRVVYAIDPACSDARVPSLILQPIAENAIVHAIARRTDGGTLTISAMRNGDRLILEVCNDGAPDEDAKHGHGVGLNNTRERLACLYGNEYAFDLARDADGITRVRIAAPFVRGTSRAGESRAFADIQATGAELEA
jgi:Histidine kinase